MTPKNQNLDKNQMPDGRIVLCRRLVYLKICFRPYPILTARQGFEQTKQGINHFGDGRAVAVVPMMILVIVVQDCPHCVDFDCALVADDKGSRWL